MPQRCAETTFSSRNVSARSARSKMPRRLTQAPRLVETVTSGEGVLGRRERTEDAAEGFLSREIPTARRGDLGGNRERRWAMAARRLGRERNLGKKRLQFLRRQIEAGEALPLRARRHAHALLEGGHLLRVHQPSMIVLMTGKGQAVALDRIGDKAGRLVVGNGVKRVEYRAHIVTGEIGHQPPQRLVVVLVEDRANAGIAVEIAAEMLSPALAALVDERGIERIRAGVDPFAQ